jgi:hypothetical protein
MVDLAVACYLAIVESAVPVAIVFGLGNLLVSTFLRTAFGGKLVFQ